MHTMNNVWITSHGMKKLRGERTELRDWLNRLATHVPGSKIVRRNKEIDLILSEKQVLLGQLERLDSVLEHSRTLPELWGHKTEVHIGDTVYLRDHDHIRVIVLAAAKDADPTCGKVAATSPIGQGLLGRHLGEHTMLSTLDGYKTYEVLKII